MKLLSWWMSPHQSPYHDVGVCSLTPFVKGSYFNLLAPSFVVGFWGPLDIDPSWRTSSDIRTLLHRRRSLCCGYVLPSPFLHPSFMGLERQGSETSRDVPSDLPHWVTPVQGSRISTRVFEPLFPHLYLLLFEWLKLGPYNYTKPRHRDGPRVHRNIRTVQLPPRTTLH